ncbi:hypothetical protein GJ744_011788 [Endocarpon pusillum]|uniref:Ubiquitin-like protease family profile domain-containing protein n=1 Tax=Endocarpon pusillum TaxID=364733 RepID=A0A8H7AFD9_9EURO|nr:hypothetical protein GJ744_011788 [Endocarpon pusillum]
MVEFVSAPQERFRREEYTISPLRSAQQLNDYDCGLYVIENARSFLNGQPLQEIIGNAARVNVATRLYGPAMNLRDWTLRRETES